MTEQPDRRVSTYATNLPGRVPYDEARRATADLSRLARIWVNIAEANEDALNPVETVEYEDENGEELPIPAPAIRLDPNLRKESLAKEVREHWVLWKAGVERAVLAIGAVRDEELGPERVAARRAIMELTRIFFPPMFLLPHEQPGDHLMRPAGPMACRTRGQSNLRRYEIEKITIPLADFSDLMITYDPLASTSSQIDLEADSGWIVGRLLKAIGRGRTTVTKWREKAEPPVERRVRHQSFTCGELLRIADAAERCHDIDAAGQIRTLVTARTTP